MSRTATAARSSERLPLDFRMVAPKAPTLKINRVAKPARPTKSSLVVGFDEARTVILASEASADLPEAIRGELPAIVTHWLQSPKDKPVLLDKSYRGKWLHVLRMHCYFKSEKSPARPPTQNFANRPVHIDFTGLPFHPVLKTPSFSFIDLFAGIGGFRIAMQELEGKCVFSSEWDLHAKETYYNNFGEIPFGDITGFTNTDKAGSLPAADLPKHDVLCAGFPCQPFSQAGLKRGFEDARGTLFFDILTIARQREPKVIFLENVKRLRTHDGGRTMEVICNSLVEIGYKIPHVEVLCAHDFGVPQNRERVFIVAFADGKASQRFRFPRETPHAIYRNVGDVLEKKPDPKYTLSDRLWEGHQRRLKEHRAKGNGFGYSLFSRGDEYVNTISARYWKDGSEILIKQRAKNPRALTPRECARIQGYPDKFEFHESKRHAYQQFGNSVALPVVLAIGREILSALQVKVRH